MRVLFNYNDRKLYPDFPEFIPNELLNKEWAYKIHSQTLKRLNERGGLDVCEIIGNIKRLSVNEIINYDKIRAIEELLEILKNYEK